MDFTQQQGAIPEYGRIIWGLWQEYIIRYSWGNMVPFFINIRNGFVWWGYHILVHKK